MKTYIILATLVGVTLFALLLASHDIGALAAALAALGAGHLAVAAYHAAFPLALSVVGWRVWGRQADFATFYEARWIREGVKNLLPLAQLGGDAAGARALNLAGVNAVEAAAGSVADLTAEAAGQAVFTLFGLLLLVLYLPQEDALIRGVTIGAVVAFCAAGGFLLAQRWGLLRLVENAFSWLAARFAGRDMDTLDGLHDRLLTLYRDPRPFLASVGWHVVSWVAGAGEVWLIFYLLGHPLHPLEALILESIVQAVRSAAFLIPGALGAQEAAFLLVGAALGVPPELSLLASLARRVRQIVLGVPALFVWQWREGRNWLRFARKAKGSPPPVKRQRSPHLPKPTRTP